MKAEGKKYFRKAWCFMLALIMIVSVFAAASPERVQAAAVKSFKSSGKSTVTIKDKECYKANLSTCKTNYIKFKARKTGYVTISFKAASSLYTKPGGYVTLCNSKKKAIGPGKEKWSTNYKQSWAYTRSYGVKKGKTYYFAVVSNGGVKVTASFTAVTKSSSNSKAKAKTLAKGNTAKGVMIAGSGKADWYKIDLTQSEKMKVTYSAKTNGDNDKNGIKLTFYDEDGNVMTLKDNSGKTYQYDWLTVWNTSNELTFTVVNKEGSSFTMPTGTYYVKVERVNKQSSGFYKLKWSTFQ